MSVESVLTLKFKITEPGEKIDPAKLSSLPILQDPPRKIFERGTIEQSLLMEGPFLAAGRRMFRNAVDSDELQEAMEEQYVKDLMTDAFLQKEDHAMTLTLAHSLRVALVVGDIHTYYLSPAELVISAQRGALLHDIGKGENPDIPSSVLKKKKKLTDEEFSGIQTHPNVGYERAISHSSHEAAVAIDIQKHHCCQGERSYHERIDDDDKSPEAQRLRILAMGDTIESLLDRDRDYDRKGIAEWAPEKIFVELKTQFGDAFSDELYEFAIKSGLEHKDRFTPRSKISPWG